MAKTPEQLSQEVFGKSPDHLPWNPQGAGPPDQGSPPRRHLPLTLEEKLWAEADQGARSPVQPEAALAFRGAGGSGPALLSNHERLP